MKPTIIFLFLLFTSAISFCQIKSIDSESLAKMLEGSYSSEEQSLKDPDYSDIRIHIKRIWNESPDAKWLYFEEARASDPDNPYRQGVYRITNTYEGRFETAEFMINEPLRFAGDWKKIDLLSGLTPDSLVQIKGCSVILTLMNDGSYDGGTRGKNCLNNDKGARYSVSDVIVREDEMTRTQMGYDENDNLVWGNEKAAYVFKKLK